MDERIPRKVLEAARRRLHHRLLAAIMTAMADSDTSVDLLAARLGKSPEVIQEWLRCFIEARGATLDMVSDILFACGGATLELRIGERYPNG